MTLCYYKLSGVAESDISDIYDYTLENFSAKQAILYLQGLERCFKSLIDQPNIGKERPEIRTGLRSFLYEKHTVFYRIDDDYIRIIRVLNSHRDLPQHL
jgi:toxin ParE1/3/4